VAWRRLGRLYGPSGQADWARSHAALPTPARLDGDLYRVFFSTRDDSNRSSVAWVDVELGDSPAVRDEGRAPVLGPGPAGGFDDSGVGVGCIVPCDGEDRLYYMGWNLGVTAPWRNGIGVASGSRGAPAFAPMYQGPIMDRSPEDPFTLSYPWVIRLAPDDWRMWYGSNRAWGATSADMEHVIKHARSQDGLHWERSPAPAVDFAASGEFALARPCVVPVEGGFRMWFAARGEAYRIAAAVSEDGLAWRRCDEEYGLAPSGEGWESEAACYPCVVEHNGRLFLFYNGDGYGRTGFGLAVWQ